MAWENPVTTWGQAGKTVPGAGDFNRIEGNIQELQNTKETPAGAQAKAEAAAGAVQAELAAHLAETAPHGIGDKSTLLTTEKSTIVGAVNELFTDVSNGKTSIASAITDMGQLAAGSDTFAQLAAKIRNISNDATAGVGDVLAGKTFYQGGVKRTGTIPSKGAATIIPGTANQTIAAGQYLSGAQTILGDPNLVPANILSGKTIFGIAGDLHPLTPDVYFWKGVLLYPIEAYLTRGTGIEFSQETDYLWVRHLTSESPWGGGAVYSNSISMTGVSKIIIDWEFAKTGLAWCSFKMNTTKGTEDYGTRIYFETAFSRRVDVLDVSAISGNWYLHVELMNNSVTASTGELKVYRIFIQY